MPVPPCTSTDLTPYDSHHDPHIYTTVYHTYSPDCCHCNTCDGMAMGAVTVHTATHLHTPTHVSVRFHNGVTYMRHGSTIQGHQRP